MKAKTSNDIKVIEKIINKCDVCYLAMVDKDNMPYVLPFNFGYDSHYIYLHSGPDGKKIDILKSNNNVCIAFSTDNELFQRHDTVACSCGMKFKSVIAYGKVEFVEDYNQKIEILNKIMLKYTGKEFTYNAPAVNNVAVFKVYIESITAKTVGY